MVDAVNANGGNAKLTVYEKTAHDVWTKTFENKEVWEWLLSHKSKYQETKSSYDNVKVLDKNTKRLYHVRVYSRKSMA